MPEYIERENLLDGISSPESGFDDTIENLMFEHNLDFLHDNDEDEVRAFANELIGKVKNYIATEPTADVVEVVRCKDCLYATERYGHLECINGISYRNYWNKPDDYCSHGKRKDGDGNDG